MRPTRAPVHADVVISGVILVACAVIWAVTAGFNSVPVALVALWLASSARGRPDEVREPVHRLVYITGAAVLVFMTC
jgi:hypothetical protein